MNIFTFFRANLLSGLKPATHFAALLIAVFLLAACGGGGSSGGSSGGGDNASAGGGGSSGGGGPSDIDGDGIANSVDVDADGDGLIEIYTATQLNMMRNNLNGTGLDTDNSDMAFDAGGDSTGCGNGGSITTCNGYEQMADIDLDDLPKDSTGSNWEPVGSCVILSVCLELSLSSQLHFSGIFSGNDFTISNMFINATTERYGVGFFGFIAPTAELRNVHIRGGNIVQSGVASINGSSSVGGLVGSAVDGGIISDSSVTLDAISGTGVVGGLVGLAFNSTISFSVATVGSISGVFHVGGLVGLTDHAIIDSSAVTVGSISGTDASAGGLVGDGFNATISSSVVTVGSISGTDAVGGLAGFGDYVTISSSVATVGSISGTNASVGGLVGSGFNAAISSSVAITNSITGSIDIGGLVGISGSLAPSSVTDSYWDDSVTLMPATGNTFGSSQSTATLRNPTEFTGIYVNWANAWCNPNTGEYSSTAPIPIGDYIRVWDLGTGSQYPAITCVGSFFSLADQRAATARVVFGLSPIQ